MRNFLRLTSAEFRYLRLALGLSQVSLASLMGNTENTIANWERTGKLLAMGDKLIRVLYQAHRNGERSVKDVVASLNFFRPAEKPEAGSRSFTWTLAASA